MEQLSNALRALFGEQEGDNVLYSAGMLKINGKYNHNDNRYFERDSKESDLMKLLRKINVYNTIDQQSIVCQIIQSEWEMPNQKCSELKYMENSIFNILLHFGCKTLFLKDGYPVCRYSRLLRWHLVTSLLGEDLFTTSYIAAYDVKNNLKRDIFNWNAFVDHDNKELNAVLSRPIADLHMHLKGSSYNFDLSWLSIMNNIDKMNDSFNYVYEKRKYDDWDIDLYNKMYKASAIRLYLASRTKLINKEITLAQLDFMLNLESLDTLKKLEEERLKSGNMKDTLYKPLSFRQIIDEIKIKDKNNNTSFYQDVDYIKIANYTKETVTSILASEREFMYRVFHLILDGEDDEKIISTLFYAYISYKSKFRQSVVQLNDTVGFHNFSDYEELKESFIVKKYRKYLYKAAVESFLTNNNSERYLETRIVPDENEEEITLKIKEIYDSVNTEISSKFHIILHFIKRRDYRVEKKCRHEELRKQIKRQAFAIYKFRNNTNNWNDNPLAGRVVGIDAANSEIYCRPEVFAQAFRFLRNHKIEDGSSKRPNDLNITFHVGEDFFDVADGLRAVEEAIIFLNLKNGDRLGHCLVLGTNVRKYYEMRYHTICTTKQVLLDNMAWLHHKCKRLIGYTPLCYYLESTFHNLFLDVYGAEKYNRNGEYNYDSVFNEDSKINTEYNIQDYYLSWFLRGNSPSFGADMDSEPILDIEKEWLYASENHHIGVEEAKSNKNAIEINEMYHRDRVVINGANAQTFTIREEYRDDFYMLLEAIQEQLLNKIEKKRIAIECNPSSNYKIGEMTKYEDHPIIKFFNAGLNTPYKPHNIAVSINTDDQGVFSTSLEREYSLIALAIERNKSKGFDNSPRMIIDWLDKIREMSIEQLFYKQ